MLAPGVLTSFRRMFNLFHRETYRLPSVVYRSFSAKWRRSGSLNTLLGMNVVMSDMMYCDEIEVSLPATPLNRGQTHHSMDANIRAICESIGLELITYDSAMRIPVGNYVKVIIRGKGCQDRNAR